MLRRIHDQAVWLSHCLAFGAFQGASSGTFARHPVEAQHRLADVGQHVRAQARDRAACSASAGRPSRRTFSPAVQVGKVAAPCSRASAYEAVLRGADPLAADVDPRCRRRCSTRLEAAADAVARLEHRRRSGPRAVSSRAADKPGHARRPTTATSASIEPAAAARASAERTSCGETLSPQDCQSAPVDNLRRMTSRREEKEQRRAERLAREQPERGAGAAPAPVLDRRGRRPRRSRRSPRSSPWPPAGGGDGTGAAPATCPRPRAASSGAATPPPQQETDLVARRPGGRLRAAQPGDRGPHPRPSGQGRQVQDEPAHVRATTTRVPADDGVYSSRRRQRPQALRAHARARPDRDPVRPDARQAPHRPARRPVQRRPVPHGAVAEPPHALPGRGHRLGPPDGLQEGQRQDLRRDPRVPRPLPRPGPRAGPRSRATGGATAALACDMGREPGRPGARRQAGSAPRL